MGSTDRNLRTRRGKGYVSGGTPARDMPPPPIHSHPTMPTNTVRITFETKGTCLDACNNAAEVIARDAFNRDDFHLVCSGYTALHQKVDNTVLVWQGSYTASIQVPVE